MQTGTSQGCSATAAVLHRQLIQDQYYFLMNQRRNRSGVKLASYLGKTASKFNKTLDLHSSDGSLDVMRCALKSVDMAKS